jgi:hypothetical protein
MTDVAAAPGEDLTLHIPVTDPDGNPADVAGADGEFIVHDAPLSHTILFAGSMSLVDFVLPGSATESFTAEFHVLYYETWLIDTGGARTRLDNGKLTLA